MQSQCLFYRDASNRCFGIRASRSPPWPKSGQDLPAHSNLSMTSDLEPMSDRCQCNVGHRAQNAKMRNLLKKYLTCSHAKCENSKNNPGRTQLRSAKIQKKYRVGSVAKMRNAKIAIVTGSNQSSRTRSWGTIKPSDGIVFCSLRCRTYVMSRLDCSHHAVVDG